MTDSLMKRLIRLDSRIAFNRKLDSSSQGEDRKTLHDIIYFLDRLQSVNLLYLLEKEAQQ